MSIRWLSLIALCFAITASCGRGLGSPSYTCDATVELIPSRFGNLFSPGGRGSGSGSGGSQSEALAEALKVACSKLNLDPENRRKCENNEDFGVSITEGRVTLVSPGAVSWDCEGGN